MKADVPETLAYQQRIAKPPRKVGALERVVWKLDRPPSLHPEKVEQIIAALDGGTSKASVCGPSRYRARLLNTLERVGWTGAGAQNSKRTPTKQVA